MNEKTLNVLIQTYIGILRLPCSSWRIDNQEIYVMLREEIANALNLSSQETQEKYERIAAELGKYC